MPGRRRLIVVLPILCLAVAATMIASPLLTNAQDKEDPPTSSDEQARRMELMRGKLHSTHKIVDGLATDDFELIAAGASELVKIADSAAWEIPNDVYYRYYSANFEQAARGLIEAAEKKNLEKATFAYVHVTISCTACHQHVRNVFRVAEDNDRVPRI